MHSKIQEKLHQEIIKIIKTDDDLKSLEIINSIGYLDLVQKEAFRLFPTAPIVMREILEDFEMEPGLVIPKNTNFTINLYALHRQPGIWGEDADKFKPERFCLKTQSVEKISLSYHSHVDREFASQTSSRTLE